MSVFVWLVGWLVVCLFGWSVGWLVGWLFVWLVGWLVGCLFVCLSVCLFVCLFVCVCVCVQTGVKIPKMAHHHMANIRCWIWWVPMFEEKKVIDALFSQVLPCGHLMFRSGKGYKDMALLTTISSFKRLGKNLYRCFMALFYTLFIEEIVVKSHEIIL